MALLLRPKYLLVYKTRRGELKKKNGWGEKRREEEGKGREEKEKRRRNEEQKGMEL